jgi:hypothetical protein
MTLGPTCQSAAISTSQPRRTSASASWRHCKCTHIRTRSSDGRVRLVRSPSLTMMWHWSAWTSTEPLLVINTPQFRVARTEMRWPRFGGWMSCTWWGRGQDVRIGFVMGSRHVHNVTWAHGSHVHAGRLNVTSQKPRIGVKVVDFAPVHPFQRGTGVAGPTA